MQMRHYFLREMVGNQCMVGNYFSLRNLQGNFICLREIIFHKEIFFLTVGSIYTLIEISRPKPGSVSSIRQCIIFYYSLISVGGDGTFRQVLHGLMTRTATDEGKNVDDPDIEWSTPKQWIGVIPSGIAWTVCLYYQLYFFTTYGVCPDKCRTISLQVIIVVVRKFLEFLKVFGVEPDISCVFNLHGALIYDLSFH